MERATPDGGGLRRQPLVGQGLPRGEVGDRLGAEEGGKAVDQGLGVALGRHDDEQRRRALGEERRGVRVHRRPGTQRPGLEHVGEPHPSGREQGGERPG
jgi:hypothetical protein